MCLVENGGKEAQQVAEVICIPKTIPERTGYQIRSIRVCAYCRVSTDDDGQYHSYDAQMEYYKGLIQKNPAWKFCGIYADEGISGTSRWGREDFQRMLEECEKGRIDLILTKSITRFARNTVDTLSTVRHLKEIGVSVYFEKEHLNTMTEESEGILTVYGAVAQQESENISQNVHWSAVNRFRHGTFVISRRPYGYDKDEAKELAVKKDEAAWVRRMASMYMNGMSGVRIAEYLNQNQVAAPYGGLWSSEAVLRILFNEKTVGDCLHQKTYSTGTVPFRTERNHGKKPQYFIRDDHEGILCRDEQMRLQQIKRHRLGHRARMKSCGNEGAYILSGKVVCGECGRVFIRKKEQRQKGVSIKWRCPGHRSEACQCYTNEIWEADIERMFVNTFNTLKEHADEIVDPVIRGMKKMQETNGLHEALDTLNQKKLELKEQRHILRQLKANECIDSALYFEESRKIERELSRCRSEEKQLHSRGTHQDTITGLQAVLHQLQGYDGKMQAFDGDQFILLVREVSVGKERELGFHLRCGLILHEPVI